MAKKYHIAHDVVVEAVNLALGKIYIPSGVKEKTITVKEGVFKTSRSLKRSSFQATTIAKTTRTKKK